MFVFWGHAHLLVLLLHLLPVGMTLLTWKFPWKKARIRIAFTQMIASIAYIVVFPLFLDSPGPFNILNAFDIWSGMGWVCVLPVVTAGLVSSLLILFQQKKKSNN